MAKNSAKSKARALYIENPDISLNELLMVIGDEVQERTAQKYLIEFRNQLGRELKTIPEEISMKKLEAELAAQLETNPNSSVIKSCIDFLRLKQSTDDKSTELDMEQFIKKAKNMYI